MSPLLQAIGRGRGADTARAADAVRLLLDLGADPTAMDAGGQTPLHAAAAAGAVEVVRLLLDAGASVDARNKRGDTPLTLAERLPDKTTADLLRRQMGAAK